MTNDMKTQLSTKNNLVRALIVLGILALASGAGFALRAFGLPEANVAIVYLLAVLLSALIVPSYLFGFISSVLSAFAFNFLFTAPYFTFTSNAPSYIITFVIMTITAFITSSLASHAKISERKAQESEAEARALYSLTNRLTDAADIHDIAAIAADEISDAVCARSACLCLDETGMPEKSFVQQLADHRQIRREVNDPEALMRRMAGLPGGTDAETEFYDWPICGKETILGIIRIPCDEARFLTKAQERLLRSMIESVALAMDRFRSAQQRIHLRQETEQERYRGNLLRSISHDLRTPLSGILGTTEMLSDMTQRDDRRYELIEGIGKDARWLYSLVENVLSLTRLQDGKLVLHKQPEAVEEVLGGVIGYMSRRFPEYEIEVQAPDELLMVPMDAKLISQVLINLMENAVKHTAPPGEISIAVSKDVRQRQAVFSVRDTGSGISPADLPHIFQMFYTAHSGNTDSRPGIGLGLTICESIVKAHGGTIRAQNRADERGAEFIFTLPLEEES